MEVKVFVTRPLGTNCRRLIYLAGELAAKFPGDVEVIIDEGGVDEPGTETPRPYILIDDYIAGKNVELAILEKIVLQKIGAG